MPPRNERFDPKRATAALYVPFADEERLTAVLDRLRSLGFKVYEIRRTDAAAWLVCLGPLSTLLRYCRLLQHEMTPDDLDSLHALVWRYGQETGHAAHPKAGRLPRQWQKMLSDEAGVMNRDLEDRAKGVLVLHGRSSQNEFVEAIDDLGARGLDISGSRATFVNTPSISGGLLLISGDRLAVDRLRGSIRAGAWHPSLHPHFMECSAEDDLRLEEPGLQSMPMHFEFIGSRPRLIGSLLKQVIPSAALNSFDARKRFEAFTEDRQRWMLTIEISPRVDETGGSRLTLPDIEEIVDHRITSWAQEQEVRVKRIGRAHWIVLVGR